MAAGRIAFTAAAALGTSPPSIPNAFTGLATSDDQRGMVTFGSGTAPTTGKVCSAVFGGGGLPTLLGFPTITITPMNAATAALGLWATYTVAAGGGTPIVGFEVYCQTAPAASQTNTTYEFAYEVVL